VLASSIILALGHHGNVTSAAASLQARTVSTLFHAARQRGVSPQHRLGARGCGSCPWVLWPVRVARPWTISSPTLFEADFQRRYNVQIVGRAPSVLQQFFAISVVTLGFTVEGPGKCRGCDCSDRQWPEDRRSPLAGDRASS